MKKTGILLALLCVLSLFFFWKHSQKPEILHMGLNAVVLSVDAEAGTVTVKDPAREDVFGDSCVLSWGREPVEVVYCDFETNVLTVIDVADLRPGDAITVNALEAQVDQADSGRIQIQQIQLTTQRIK